MKTVFVNTKSELSGKVAYYLTQGYAPAYRTRLNCQCPYNTLRHGALILNGNMVVACVIKCKRCANNKEVPHV